MPAKAATATRSGDPSTLPSRPVRLIRVSVLMVTGLAIAFTATMHEQLGFDIGVAAIALGVLGIAHLIEWFAARGPARTPVALLLGAASIVAAVAVFMTETVIGFAVVLAAWALVSALLEFIGATTRPGTRSDSTMIGVLGILLALSALLVRDDQVAILGFFGAYAIIAGVFLGISAFDSRRPTASTESAPSAQH